jgi:hypothetical protein
VDFLLVLIDEEKPTCHPQWEYVTTIWNDKFQNAVPRTTASLKGKFKRLWGDKCPTGSANIPIRVKEANQIYKDLMGFLSVSNLELEQHQMLQSVRQQATWPTTTTVVKSNKLPPEFYALQQSAEIRDEEKKGVMRGEKMLAIVTTAATTIATENDKNWQAAKEESELRWEWMGAMFATAATSVATAVATIYAAK